LPDKNKLTEDLHRFENLDAKDDQLIQKLDEFMALLEKSDIDSDNIKGIKNKVNKALDKKLGNGDVIRELKELSLSDIEKADQLDQLEKILSNNYLDSRQVNDYKIREGLSKVMRVIIGFLLITLGFAMIIMPAPPYFEMFTIFYFSPDDGVTLMDLISLIIIATGTFIVIRSVLNVKKNE
jgi:hypothetical protein